jgi:predicted N-formylglutamate amidohydrolase
MREEERILELDRYEHGVMVNALNEFRNDLIEEKQSTDAVDDLLIKTIDAPTRKVKRRGRDEAR